MGFIPREVSGRFLYEVFIYWKKQLKQFESVLDPKRSFCQFFPFIQGSARLYSFLRSLFHKNLSVGHIECLVLTFKRI